jgi:hypothetical protein
VTKSLCTSTVTRKPKPFLHQDSKERIPQKNSMHYLQNAFSDRIIGRGLWLPYLPLLKPLDIFFLFNLRMLKDTTCSKNHHIHNDLQQSIPKVVSSLLPRQIRSTMRNVFLWVTCVCQLKKTISGTFLKLIKPTCHVMHHQFNIQQLYGLPTLHLCVLYLSENRQRHVPLTALTDWFS